MTEVNCYRIVGNIVSVLVVLSMTHKVESEPSYDVLKFVVQNSHLFCFDHSKYQKLTKPKKKKKNSRNT